MGVGEESAEVGHGFCDAGGTGELGEGRVRVSIRTRINVRVRQARPRPRSTATQGGQGEGTYAQEHDELPVGLF